MRVFLMIFAFVLNAAALATSAPEPIKVSVPQRSEPVSYINEVADILAAKCVGCHSEVLAENRLNLEDVPRMLKGGKRGPAIVPGKADASLLFQMSAHLVEPVMPPKDKKDAPRLTSEELGVIKLWIDAGARDDSEENSPGNQPIELGTLPPGVQPINAVDMTVDGARVACGRANVVQVYDVESGMEILSLGGHKDLIQSVRFSPNGGLLAAGSYQIATVWNAPTGGLKTTFKGHTDQVKVLVDGPGASGLFASGSLDKTVRVWNAEGKALHVYNLPAPVLALAAAYDLSRFAVGGADGVARFIDVSGGDVKELAALKGHTGPINDLALFHPRDAESPRLATASNDGTVRLWQIPTRPDEKVEAPKTIADLKVPLKALAVSPLGDLLAVGGDDGAVRLYSVPDGKEIRTIQAHSAPVLDLAFRPDARQILTGSADKSARVFDVNTGALQRTLTSHLGPVNSVAFSHDGNRLVTAGAEGGAKVWEASTGQGVIVFGHAAPDNGEIQPIQSVLLTATGRIVTASADKTIKSWTTEGAWSLNRVFGPHVFRVLAIDFNPDGTLMATAGGEPSRSGELKLWELGKGLHVRTMDSLHSDTIFAVRFSPDGSQLATAGADKFLKVTRVSDGKEIRAFEGHTHHVLAVDWKSDGKQIVTGGGDNVLKLWDVDTGEQVRTMQGAGKQVTAVRWVPGKAEIFGACGDKSVRMWSPDNNNPRRTYSGPGDYVFGVAVSNDGSRVAAGGADSVLFLWNGSSAKVLRKMEPPPR